MTGTSLDRSETGTGESARADARVDAAGLEQPAAERILVRSGDAAADRRRGRRPRAAPRARCPPSARSRARATRRLSDRRRAHRARRGQPARRPRRRQGARRADRGAPSPPSRARTRTSPLQQAGAGTIDKDVRRRARGGPAARRAHLAADHAASILLLAFGAIVAASVPLLLGLTSVAAAMGALGVVSQVAPDGGSAGALVVLIGLAVGVDYSLFYIRREREERRAGNDTHAALDVDRRRPSAARSSSPA